MEKLRQYIAYLSSITFVFGMVFLVLNSIVEQLPVTKNYTVNNKVYVKDLIIIPIAVVITSCCFKFKPPKKQNNHKIISN